MSACEQADSLSLKLVATMKTKEKDSQELLLGEKQKEKIDLAMTAEQEVNNNVKTNHKNANKKELVKNSKLENEKSDTTEDIKSETTNYPLIQTETNVFNQVPEQELRVSAKHPGHLVFVENVNAKSNDNRNLFVGVGRSLALMKSTRNDYLNVPSPNPDKKQQVSLSAKQKSQKKPTLLELAMMQRDLQPPTTTKKRNSFQEDSIIAAYYEEEEKILERDLKNKEIEEEEVCLSTCFYNCLIIIFLLIF